MKIATIQSKISENIWENVNEITKLIEKSASLGANLAHFPEGALSGYPKQQIKSWDQVNWLDLDKAIKKIQNICKSQKINAAFGCNYKYDKDNRPFNSVLLFSDSGQIINRYDKRFCSHSEITDWYTAGTKPITISLNGLKFGIILCIEVNFPELFLEYEKMDVDCILLSTYSESKMFAIQAQGHAACNNYWISFSTPQNMSSVQQSIFIGPDGSVVGQCKPNHSDITINTIDLKDPDWDIPCNKARPWRRLARTQTIYR